jgi:hypothetical protein
LIRIHGALKKWSIENERRKQQCRQCATLNNEEKRKCSMINNQRSINEEMSIWGFEKVLAFRRFTSLTVLYSPLSILRHG